MITFAAFLKSVPAPRSLVAAAVLGSAVLLPLVAARPAQAWEPYRYGYGGSWGDHGRWHGGWHGGYPYRAWGGPVYGVYAPPPPPPAYYAPPVVYAAPPPGYGEPVYAPY